MEWCGVEGDRSASLRHTLSLAWSVVVRRLGLVPVLTVMMLSDDVSQWFTLSQLSIPPCWLAADWAVVWQGWCLHGYWTPARPSRHGLSHLPPPPSLPASRTGWHYGLTLRTDTTDWHYELTLRAEWRHNCLSSDCDYPFISPSHPQHVLNNQSQYLNQSFSRTERLGPAVPGELITK